MFKIRPEHIRTFQPNAEAAFTRGVMEYVRTNHADAIVKLPGGEKVVGELNANVLRKMVEGGIAQSRRQGLELKSAMISFVTTMFLTAPNFDEHPIAKQILGEIAKLAGQSFDKLLDEMTDEHWAEVEKKQNPKAWNAPLEEPKPSAAVKPTETVKSVEATKTVAEVKPVAEAKPIEKVLPAQPEKSAEVLTLGAAAKPQPKPVKKPAKKAALKKQVKAASRTQHAAPVAPKQPCPNKNWIELIYKTHADRPVANASYILTDANGGKIASGTLDQRGFAHVGGLPDGLTNVNITYTGDPKPFEIFNDKKPIKNPYFELPPRPAEAVVPAAAPPNKYLAAAADAAVPVLKLALAYQQAQMEIGKWTWGAIQGDWNDDQTVGQIVFDSAVTMIPVVDQVGDVRDLTANLYQLTVKRKYNEFGPWLGFVMTLIGLIPEAGTAIKGAAKCVIRVGKNAAGVVIEKGVKFGEHLIQKSGIDIDGLIRVMNGFGEGNAVRWLGRQVERFDEFRKFAKDKAFEILSALKAKCLELKNRVYESAAAKLDSIIKSIDETMNRAADFIGEIMSRVWQELKALVERVKNYFIKGTTQTQNGAIQIADELPTSAAPTAATKRRRKMAEIDAEDLRKTADAAGMEPQELAGLLNHCNETNRRVIVRFTNPDSLRWHGKPHYVPKSVDVKLKTAKSGDNAGLVVKPKEPMEDWEIENIDALKKKGYEFYPDGSLIDSKGNRIYGDYDLQAVHTIDPNTGKATDLMTSPNNSVVAEVNGGMGRKDRQMLEQRTPVQHGAENDFHIKTETVQKKDAAGNVIKVNGKPVMETRMVYENPAREFDWIRDPQTGQMVKVKAAPGKPVPASPEDIKAGNSTLGKQYGDDEKYLVVNPDGTTEILKNPRALYDLNRKSGLPWRYDSVPATGEELAAAQAKKQAKKEAIEKMAAAEAKAQKEQMKQHIDGIINDLNGGAAGKQSVPAALRPASNSDEVGFWKDNNLGLGEGFYSPGAAPVKDSGAVPW